jgi:glycosyltransferase involved in cell wall biosynthesis
MGATIETSSVQNIQSFLDYDIIVAPRQYNPDVYEALRVAAWEGKLLIYEVDDDLDHVLPSSPAYKHYHKGSMELKWLPKIMQVCHGLTTTTPEIALWYSNYFSNIRIIENFIDFSLRDWNADVAWFEGSPVITPKPKKRLPELEGKRVIMWSGGSTHREDLQSIAGSIRKILEDYEDTVFVLYAGLEMVSLFAGEGIPLDRMYHVQARHFIDHPEMLHIADIGLAPLVGCQFNVCKSNLKVLETFASGAACVASNIGPYARFNRKHPNLLLTVGKADDSFRGWYDAIAYLLDNPQECQERGDRGRRLVIEQYSLERNIHLWPLAWRSISDSVSKGITGPPENPKPAKERLSWGTTGPNDECPCGSKLKYKNCCVDAWG